MKILGILIEERIKEKIFDKHAIDAEEIEQIMLSNPFILKSKEQRYMAIGYYKRYITIIFEMIQNSAFIITAYPSSEAQKALWKRKK